MMKNLRIFVLLNCIALTLNAQKIDDINEMIDKQQFAQARTAIDQYLENPKKAKDIEALYRRGTIYNSLSKETSNSLDSMYFFKNVSFEAFKKYQMVDLKDQYLTLENHASYFDLYYGFYDLGAKQFNSKNFEGAMSAFKKANEIKDFILSKKYEYPETKLSVIDTALILNIGASAIQAKKEAEAVASYKILIDANIDGQENKEIYQYVLDYLYKTDNNGDLQSNIDEVLSKAKKIYPNDDIWIDMELKAISKKGDRALLFSKYDQLIAENPNSFLLPYNYSVEMYNDLYGKEASRSGDWDLSNKLTGIIKKAIDNEEKTDVSASMLMANHLFNMSADMINASKKVVGKKPEDLKKKTELKSMADKSMNECITYSEKLINYFEAISSKTPIQKANYKIVLGYLSDIYFQKNNPTKAAEYDKKNAAADKL